MTQKRHTIHGRDHVPGGADPIPNWPSGGGGHIIEENWTPLPARTNLNFRGYVDVTDDTANDSTNVEILAADTLVSNPRFVSAIAQQSVPASIEYHVSFTPGGGSGVVTNDDPAGVGYLQADGGNVSGSTWNGDHFAASTTDAFAIKRVKGLYLISATMEMYLPSSQAVTVRITLPWATGAGGWGIGAFVASHEYQERVTLGPASDQRHWSRNFFCVMRDPQGGADTSTPQPVGFYVTQLTGATLTAGPPRFGLACTLLNLTQAAAI